MTDQPRTDEDQQLVARTQEGDVAAFDQLVVKYTPRLYGLVYSPVSDRSGLEPAIADAIAAPTPTMVAVRFRREDSVSGHRLCWEAAASALKS